MDQPQPEAPQSSTRASLAAVIALMHSRRIAWAAFKIALVVGTLLNLINNGPLLWAQRPIGWWQLAMNYLVPFCVSAYSAARNEVQRARSL